MAQSLLNQLSQYSFFVKLMTTQEELLEFLADHGDEVDCLVILQQPDIFPVFNEMFEQGILLPMVLLSPNEEEKFYLEPTYVYHSAETRLSLNNINELPLKIAEAIERFLHLGQSCSLIEKNNEDDDFDFQHPQKHQRLKILQQRKLTDKLKERLGYLGVYYRRNPKLFYRNLGSDERNIFLQNISDDYRQIIINYFNVDIDINPEIDQYVNNLFFYDFSVSQVLEIHMELMDSFSQQLKLEGKSEEILLDYRLVIIDILAHLCEMYRRSIPREDVSSDFSIKT